MNAAEKRELKAAEYRRLAIAAGVLAEASPLTNIREKHEHAAAQWTALAVLSEQPAQERPPQTRGRESARL